MRAVNLRALRHYQDQRERLDRPEAVAMNARILHAIGEDELNWGHQEAAQTTLTDAYRRTDLLIHRFPNDPNVVFTHGQSEYWIGFAAYSRRDFVRARQAWQHYKDVTDRLLALDPRNPRSYREDGYAWGNLCTIALAPPTDAATALVYCSRALARMEQAQRLRSRDPRLIVDVANRHAWLVDVLSANGRWEEARDHLEKQEAQVRLLLQLEPDNFNYRDIWMRSEFGFGRRLAEHGERQHARQRFQEAAAAARLLSDRDPENATWRDFQTQIRNRLAALSTN
jgi:tetratricopeptide (TPR) repeat protein